MTEKTTARGGEVSARHLLHRAGQWADTIFIEQIAKDLTPRQFAVLECVAAQDDVSQTDIVERTGIDRSTLADLVARMTERGLLQRQRTKTDARRYAIRLSKAGKDLLRRSRPAADAADDKLLSVLPPDQKEALLRSLARLVNSLEEAARRRREEARLKRTLKLKARHQTTG